MQEGQAEDERSKQNYSMAIDQKRTLVSTGFETSPIPI